MGMVLITLSYVLEPVFACLYRRRKYGRYRYLEWAATETLQLQRASYQGIRSGTWSGYTAVIPRTDRAEKLAHLPFCASTDDDDAEHGNYHERSSSGHIPTATPVTTLHDSVDRLSLDDLILDQGSSINGATLSRAGSR